MKVGDLLKALSDYPPELDVVIEGYEAGREDGDRGYRITMIGALHQENVEDTVVIWAVGAYQNIERAALEIAYDNGGIHRDRNVSDHKRELHSFLAMECSFSDEQLKTIDIWLGTLSDEHLETICSGEQSDAKLLLIGAPEGTDRLLTEIFDEVC